MFCLRLIILLWRNNRPLTIFSSFSFVFIRPILSSEICWWMNIIALRPASSIFSLIIMLSFGPLDNLLFPASIVHSLPLVSLFFFFQEIFLCQYLCIQLFLQLFIVPTIWQVMKILHLIVSLNDCVFQMIEFFDGFLKFLQKVTSWSLQLSTLS